TRGITYRLFETALWIDPSIVSGRPGPVQRDATLSGRQPTQARPPGPLRLERGVGPSAEIGTRGRPMEVSDCGDLCNEVGSPAGVAVLIVVPAQHLDEPGADLSCPACIEDATVRVADDVTRDDGVFVVIENALERALGG